ncbi:hypothetical protein [Chryseolinea lacunae]|uniref:Uncharacterized protein n=1 Tax=Chryseolinea lacunae TaxID=2801331 RepID=A0ABS1KNH6_9BACT|nr:hypothetical protein [Chryseolinea lacunae]MBL0740888.1 hypothetical protein [Chryseolinea lacunae]
MGKYKAGRIENDDELKDALAQALGLHCFYIGGHVIRDERGWRQNEKSIDYAWLAIVDRFGSGVGGVFSMKFMNSDFREHKNPEQLVRGVF